MHCFHRTSFAREIIAGGFEDRRGTYLSNLEAEGVWLSDRPLDINEGADGDELLRLDIPDELLALYEWIEAEKPYRDFLVPAELVNRYGPPVLVDDIADE